MMQKDNRDEQQESQSLQGKIVRIDKDSAHVFTSQGIYLCTVRGRLKQGRKTQRNLFTVGDNVDIAITASGEGVIENVHDRRTKLSRPDTNRPEIEHVLVANVDLVAAIASIDDPPFSPGLIDHYIAAALIHNLPLLLIVNKADLAVTEEVTGLLEEFRGLGIEVILTSALNGTGIEELRERLRGTTSVFTGHSGAGKSSLLRRLYPGFDPAIAAVSERTGRGMHTTTRVELVYTDFDAYIADTPGIKLFGIWGIPPIELGFFFPDFVPHLHDCRFNNCSHRNEPGCAIKVQLELGGISRRRYQSYLDILASLEEMEEQIRPW